MTLEELQMWQFLLGLGTGLMVLSATLYVGHIVDLILKRHARHKRLLKQYNETVDRR